MEIRLAKKEDLEGLKEIWKRSFGDEDRLIDQYFQSRDWISQTAVLLQDGKSVSMLTMIPVDLIGEYGEKCPAAMIYAVATHPDYQKRGFADQLIEFSNQTLLSEHVPVTVLVPATESLFHFYEKRGYRNGFFLREAVLIDAEIEKQAGPKPPPCRVTPIEPSEYNRLRREQLIGQPYLDYREEEIFFQRMLARMNGADLFAIEIEGAEGCACAERVSKEEVILKELLIPDRYLAASLLRLSELLPAEKYTVRTPLHSGQILGGTVRPFGMLRVNEADLSASLKSYLGIAFD